MVQFMHTSDEDVSLDDETSYANVAQGHSQFIYTALPIPSFRPDVDKTNARKNVVASGCTVDNSDIARGNEGSSRDISAGKALSGDCQTYN